MSTTFTPDYAVHPGETLAEWLHAEGMSQVDLATRIDMSSKALNQMLRGIAPITSDTALRLETVTRIPAHTWNSLQALYSEDTSRLERDAELELQIDFLFSVPLSGLRKIGAVTSKRRDVRALREVCDFFEVANPSAWEQYWAAPTASYSRSVAFQANPGAVATWLRVGEIQARNLNLAAVNRSGLKSSLPKLRALSLEKDPRIFFPAAQELCATMGVALVLVPEHFGAQCSGATHWVNKHPIVQLTLRHASDSHFWFDFFHALAHVLLHGQRDSFIESDAVVATLVDEREVEADQFARVVLIPRGHTESLIELKTLDSITAFARAIGISPGIVLGRLQEDQIVSRRMGNELKNRYSF